MTCGGCACAPQMVLQADITEFQPYYVQIVAQLLERRADPIPPTYLQLLPSLLQQPLWASRSNQPALARLIKALLTRAAPEIVANQPLFLQILGLVQFLMMSKVPAAAAPPCAPRPVWVNRGSSG